ncbi:DUF6199 family natural product biosynthesis protein [Paenibacillus sp. FSL H7-0331]|uniref:DUF6199 family natural product biosynthesis protein n=1 Tax=Paenibacillus sp. FSL H7-0331 TaxID=1920421 RepID=UPI00096D1498|nr:hypothetical protein BK127_34880 [Paenibacillus sp. FSL H7-0331]
MIIVTVLLLLCGLLMLIRPAILWTITESWKSNDAAEPSDLYLWSTRFGGVMFTLVGLAGVYVYLFVSA